MIEPTETTSPHPYPFLCPQCGSPTHGWPTANGRRFSYCEDCVGDREIADPPGACPG